MATRIICEFGLRSMLLDPLQHARSWKVAPMRAVVLLPRIYRVRTFRRNEWDARLALPALHVPLSRVYFLSLQARVSVFV